RQTAELLDSSGPVVVHHRRFSHPTSPESFRSSGFGGPATMFDDELFDVFEHDDDKKPRKQNPSRRSTKRPSNGEGEPSEPEENGSSSTPLSPNGRQAPKHPADGHPPAENIPAAKRQRRSSGAEPIVTDAFEIES